MPRRPVNSDVRGLLMPVCRIPDDKLRKCADEALKAHGTAYIFEKRAATVRTRLLILSFLGIAGPASVGAIISTYSLDNETTKIVIGGAGVIAIAQLLFSIWALVSKWDSNLASYIESKSSNYNLSSRFDNLAKDTTLAQHEFDTEFKILEKEAELRRALDHQFDITDKEKRMGMRYGLRQFQRPCAQCNTVPTNMKPTSCGVCGDF